MKKNFFFKQKFLNQLIIGGNKNTCENILLKSIKTFQKTLNKRHKNLLLLSIIYSTPILKMNKTTKKKLIKEIPTLLINKKNRISLAIKYIIKMAKENKTGIEFNNKLTQEILSNSQNNGNATKFQKEQQKNVLIKKRYLMNYKWHKKLVNKYTNKN
jgi:ribosomal protein S7